MSVGITFQIKKVSSRYFAVDKYSYFCYLLVLFDIQEISNTVINNYEYRHIIISIIFH